MSGFTRRELFTAFLGGPAASPRGRRPRTLVTVFLRGGADGLNMVVPYTDPDYHRLRPTLGLGAPGSLDGCLDLDGRFGLHPAFEPLLPEYRAGRLALLHAVGSDDATRSHFEAQDQMEHGAARGQKVGGGWVARYLRALGGGGNLAAVALGTRLPEALRGAPSAAAMTDLSDLELRAGGAEAELARGALQALYAGGDPLAGAGRDTLDLLARAEGLRDLEPGASYPEGAFARGLRDVARLVKADVGLRAACLDLDGWDTHFLQGISGGLLAGRIQELSQGLAAFQADLGGRRDEVVVVVMTEFGRRAYENGSLGTDHGRASVMLVLGAGVAGGEVHGEWPGLRDRDLEGPGDLRVTTDYRSALAEVTRLCGGVPGEQVFPGYRPRPVGLVA